MTRFAGKTVAIVGFSVEGKDTIDFFLHEDCKIVCCDRRRKEELAERIALYETKGTKVTFFCGPSYLDGLQNADVIVRTPGMNPRTPELVEAQRRGVELTSATKLFFELCPASIIGVTGTKGKGTTSTLVYEVLRASGKTVYLGGNVGIPLLSLVPSMQKTDWVVYELSSFQLEDMTQSPHVAVVLRITQDHLANFDQNASNFHETRDAYVAAKSQIVRHQKAEDIVVLNAGDHTSKSFSQLTPARKYYFDRFSDNADCFVRDHSVYLREGGIEKEVARADSVKLRGDHNLENIAAATLVCRSIGISLDVIKETARTFDGLEHRLEFVRTLHGVSYYDDSFSTIPETTIAAIEAFTEPKVLILGGSEKKSDFSQMGRKISETNVIGVVVVGDMTDRITEALGKAKFRGTIVTGCTNMRDMVKKAQKMAPVGSVVILSPACASFGLFTNYKDRGKQFKHEVLSLT